MFAGNFAPRNWAYCSGQILSIAQNTAVFSLMGTTYGGDGRVTFALPDMRGRVPVHSGGNATGPGLTRRNLGARSGTETETLNINQIPSHNHAPRGKSGEGDENTPESGFVADAETDLYAEGATPAAELRSMAPTTSAGGSQNHNNMQPWLAVNFIVALQGTFPSRN